jgi:hypothetical protein
MRTVEIKVVSASELSDEALERAHNNYVSNLEYFWGDEVVNTIKRGLNTLGCGLKTYSIDFSSYSQSHYRIDYDENIAEFTGRKLYSYLNHWYQCNVVERLRYSLHADGKRKSSYYAYKYDGCTKVRVSKVMFAYADCVFTGVCFDESFIKPITDYLKSPDYSLTLKDIVESCVDATIEDGCNDYEYQCSLEYFLEECEANGYEFYEDGERY